MRPSRLLVAALFPLCAVVGMASRVAADRPNNGSTAISSEDVPAAVQQQWPREPRTPQPPPGWDDGPSFPSHPRHPINPQPYAPAPAAPSTPPKYSPIPDVPAPKREPPQTQGFPMGTGPQLGVVYFCSKCKRELPSNVNAGEKCPYCGAFLAYKQDPSGKITQRAPVGKYLLIGGLVPVGIVVIGLVVWFLKQL